MNVPTVVGEEGRIVKVGIRCLERTEMTTELWMISRQLEINSLR
jgi:hypothetical protein